MINKYIFVFIFVLHSLLASSQFREDTIRQLSEYSRKYLHALFSSHNVDSAVIFWNQDAYQSLKIGYNNGSIKYKSHWDLEKLFAEDFDSFFEDHKIRIVSFENDTAFIFSDYWPISNKPYKYFFISFTLKTDSEIDSTLKWVGLDFYSEDQGKTWKLQTDHWIENFMYYLYRQGNTKRPYSRKNNYR